MRVKFLYSELNILCLIISILDVLYSKTFRKSRHYYF